MIDPLYAMLREAGVSFEMVLVANFWPRQNDPTPDIVRSFAAAHEHVVVVAREKHGGMGWDMRDGLAAARGSTLVVIDGDAQNPMEDVLRMYRFLQETGVDLGKGRRQNRGDGVYRSVISAGYNALFLLLFRTWGLWDINGKPKGLTRKAYSQLTLESNDWFLDAEIVLGIRRLGMRIGEMPVVFLENKARSSFVRMSSIWEFLVHMLRYRTSGRP